MIAGVLRDSGGSPFLTLWQVGRNGLLVYCTSFPWKERGDLKNRPLCMLIV
jgi:hypothetical protein